MGPRADLHAVDKRKSLLPSGDEAMLSNCLSSNLHYMKSLLIVAPLNSYCPRRPLGSPCRVAPALFVSCVKTEPSYIVAETADYILFC